MLNEERNNEKENNPELEAQRLFEDGMPESADAAAIPSSLDDLSDEDRENVAPDWNAESADSEDAGPENNASGEEDASMARRENRITSEAHSHIKGWGIDADPANDPTYPIKSRTNEEQLGNTWERPTLQEGDTEILISNERNNKPAIFSSKNPPKGLSGAIKRRAFRYSESDYKHWLLLVASDKIGVLEGKLDDLRHGHIPNPIAERGLKAAWKYNKKDLVKNTAVKAVVTGAAVGLILFSMRNKKKKGLVENIVSAL